MKSIALALLLLAGCTADSYRVVSLAELSIDAEPEEAAVVRAALERADARLQRLPGLRDWRSCDSITLWTSSFARERTLWMNGRANEGPLYGLTLEKDRPPDDLERDLVRIGFEARADDSWMHLSGVVRRGLCDLLWADGDAGRQAVLVADAALALDAGIELVVSGRPGPWMSARRELDWGLSPRNQRNAWRDLLQDVRDPPYMRTEETQCADVGRGFRVGLEWLVARQLVEAKGLDGLRQLGAQTKFNIPWAKMLPQAGLGVDEASWRAAAAARVDRDALIAIARATAPRYALPVILLARGAEGPRPFDELLRLSAPALRSSAGVTLPLADVPEAAAALRAAWHEHFGGEIQR